MEKRKGKVIWVIRTNPSTPTSCVIPKFSFPPFPWQLNRALFSLGRLSILAFFWGIAWGSSLTYWKFKWNDWCSVCVCVFFSWISYSGVSPKVSYSNTSSKAIQSVGQEKLGVETFSYRFNGTNGTRSTLFSREMRVLDAIDDEYGGVVVDPQRLPVNPSSFATVLHSSLSHWKMQVICSLVSQLS